LNRLVKRPGRSPNRIGFASQPTRAPGCDHDTATAARRQGLRPALRPGRLQWRRPARAAGQERHTQHPPFARDELRTLRWLARSTISLSWLLSCLEIMRDARSIRSEDRLRATSDPHLPADPHPPACAAASASNLDIATAGAGMTATRCYTSARGSTTGHCLTWPSSFSPRAAQGCAIKEPPPESAMRKLIKLDPAAPLPEFSMRELVRDMLGVPREALHRLAR
jgi:hypothetical protein